ncbi:uncharacterized protein [Oncorhynchus clarkii lewisi]|uniref:uncharacterized protein n=1 Tax=Oncorhynchus clarkii lewisi TaxID=490388 RepID=UPI0039B9ACEB
MQVYTGKPTSGDPEKNQGMRVDGLRGHNSNKNVLLLSTLHKTAEISAREDRKPAIILDYNHNKGGVDNLDNVFGTYSCRTMTARWLLVIFHNITDVSSYNAFMIWNKINPTWMPDKRNMRMFLEQLGKVLVTPHIQRRERLPRTAASAALVKAVQGAESFPDPPESAAGAARGGNCHYHSASCGSKVYNPDIKTCCCGKVSNKVLGVNLCCGTTPYGVEDRGVLCCNQTLHHVVEDGYQCSPGGHLYLPSREMVCGTRVHLNDPDKHCCGEETYYPWNEICCNGRKHHRLRNVSCCGGKAYDPSSGQMKCCAGTLYDLQFQDRLSEEAQCCGSVLMEAGSTQTCCSAPGLVVLYPTQPGFTCCGHRYPNASLWSCCAGVLHPRPEPHNTTKNVIPGPRLLPLGDLKTEVLCHSRVLLGTVESVSVKMNERSIVMVNAMDMQASRGHVSAVPFPHYVTLPDHCSSPELVPGNTYIWVKNNFSDTISFISDLSDDSFPLHSILTMC